MIRRILFQPLKEEKSFFLLGPRCTGKTQFVRAQLPDALYIDLLDGEIYHMLLSAPQDIESLFIPKAYEGWIIIDEVQRVPALLNEVHRLIENKGYRFVLTGSSARNLRKKGVNLLAGRALTFFMYPLTIQELGNQFDLSKALEYGLLPPVFNTPSPQSFLSSYVHTYLREEVLQEGLTRNMEAFSKFLEVAAFSQGSLLNKLNVSREAGLKKSTVHNYFQVLQDLLISYELPVFSRKAKRKLVQRAKFYFFDVGVYQTLRPKGVLDRPEEITGIALETLFLQSLRAVNDYYDLRHKLYYWRTQSGLEVDFVLYGENGLHAFEIKSSSNFNEREVKGLLAFQQEYPQAQLYFIYNGRREYFFKEICVIPVEQALQQLPSLLRPKSRQ